jgi:hypothetical protein
MGYIECSSQVEDPHEQQNDHGQGDRELDQVSSALVRLSPDDAVPYTPVGSSHDPVLAADD